MDDISLSNSIEKLAFIKPVDFCISSDLSRTLLFKLAASEACDAYLMSPIYYQITGRKGLWVYSSPSGQSFGFICRHPNVQQRLLVFPPLGQADYPFLDAMLAQLPRPVSGIQLARFTQRQMDDLRTAGSKNFNVIEEKTLDWRYPCHVLSAQAVAALSGSSFHNVRRNVNKVVKLDVQVMPLDDNQNIAKCEHIVNSWLEGRQEACRPEANPDYFDSLFVSWRHHRQRLDGLLLVVEGEPQGFSIWEWPASPEKPVIGHAYVSNSAVKGLPEFGLHKTCVEIARRHFTFLAIGGSEYIGLDFFKRKFRPARSCQLISAEIGG